MTGLLPWVVQHRRRLQHLLLWSALLLPLGCLATAGALSVGAASLLPLEPVRTNAAIRFLVLYVAPLFVAASLWARLRLETLDSLSHAELAVDILVTGLAFARFVVGTLLPFSGHMLFLSYTILTVRSATWYLWLAGALLVETTLFKLWLWRDVQSWSLGLALGLASALLVTLLRLRSASDQGTAPVN